jgi:hypothetical protein
VPVGLKVILDLAKTLIETGTIKHDDRICFWTDSYYSTPEEVENDFIMLYLEIADHLATNGFTPFLKDIIGNLNEEEFKIWCDYHYTVCRQKSMLGASSHGLIIGRK